MFKNADRCNTNCVKWDVLHKKMKRDDVIPMWIADMEFAVPEVVNQAIIERMKSPVYGYTMETPGLREVVCEWHNRRYDYGMKPESICFTNGVLSALSTMINMCSNEGDKIILPRPYYPNFEYTINDNKREVLSLPMKCIEQRYIIDFDELEKVIDERCKIFILCNPHNPSGTVYTKEEVGQIAAFCERHQLLIFSDEVHIDFVFNQQTVFPIMHVSEYAKNHTISLVSSSKTFNLAGLKLACALIENETLREDYLKALQRYATNTINLFSYEAMYAAYDQAEAWVDELLMVIDTNRRYAFKYIKECMPSVVAYENDATYLLWLDLTKTGIAKENVKQVLLDEAKVMGTDGAEFHQDYTGYMRLNLGCSLEMVQEALKNIKEVVDKYQKAQ
ncbi:MAG: PatB family C-S lyase [Erysipelotrichaceae bacterium]